MGTPAIFPASCHHHCRSSPCPPWLQTSLQDIEERVQAVADSLPTAAEDGGQPDSFAERAEDYYRRRPQLLSLLQDLYNRYLYLADRYSQSLVKTQACIPCLEFSKIYDADEAVMDPPSSPSSTAESSVSFQLPNPPPPSDGGDFDALVAELVLAAVDRELMAAEVAAMERERGESSRKVELQRSLLEVLESERAVLLGENARLGMRAAAAEEESRGLAAEVGWMRRRAGELARCVVQLREDHRVCLLGRRIEGLQAQIYELERRNREFCEAMTKRELEKREAKVEVDRLRAENERLREGMAAAAAEGGRWAGVGRWWGRVRTMEWAVCGGARAVTTHVEKPKKESYYYC